MVACNEIVGKAPVSLPFMNSRRRALALTVIVLVLALTALGVVLVTHSDSPAGLNASSLVLHGKLRSARISLSVSTGAVTITGNVDINFDTNQLSGTVQIPAIFSTATYRIIASHNRLYINVPSLASAGQAPWVALPLPTPKLAPLDRALMFAGMTRQTVMSTLSQHGSVTRAGLFTTYTTVTPHAHVIVPNNFPVSLPRTLRLTTSMTVGPATQFAAGTYTLSNKNFYLSVQVTVQSYNSRVVIAAPAPRSVQPVTPRLLDRILGSTSSKLRRFLTPAGIASLRQLRV